MSQQVCIDGAQGEGGGQILRTSLALSALTGTPLRVDRIRAGRKQPGLMRQHLTCVLAAAEVCDAEVSGAEVGSKAIDFRPGEVRAGKYDFSVGTAGSTSLVFQTVLWPLLFAGDCSRVSFEGGTHNLAAPPFDFIEHCFLPALRVAGAPVRARLVRHGFYPAGGGRFEVEIDRCERLAPVDLRSGGEIVAHRARAIVSRLPIAIAEREIRIVRKELGWRQSECVVEEVRDSPGPGNALLLEVQRERVTEVVTGFGRRGVPAEKVARGAVREARRYLQAGAPVGEHLADQLILPLGLAGEGAFRTLPLTAHATTNIAVAEQFLPARYSIAEEADGSVVVSAGR